MPRERKKAIKIEPKPRPVGRPPTLTLEIVEKIGDSIARGLTSEQACLVQNIPLKTFESACRRNAEFAGALKRAQAHFLEDATKDIRGGPLGWQGAAWLLERRHKAQFAKTDPAVNVQVNGQVNVFGLDATEYERLRQAAAGFMTAPKVLESGT